MKISFRNSALALSVALALGTSIPASAQDTSSGMRGNVQNEAGQVIANARIEIVHEPSGSRSTATSNAQGQFVASGLRVGGPYTITVTSDQGTQTYQNVFLSLGDLYRLNAVVEDQEVEDERYERIAVRGTSTTLDYTRTGPASTFSASDIDAMPMFNRDLKDVVRVNPLVVVGTDDAFSTSIAGANNRFNSLSVDGMRQDDDFGLNANGYPSARGPIPIEALDQISVSIAPYQAKVGGFTGGGISAVTRSGTNEWTGSVFAEYASDSMAGRVNPPGRDKFDLDPYKEQTIGFGVGGPLIEDTLFFFAAYEKWDSDFVSTGWGPFDADNVSNLADISEADLNAVRDIASSQYGVSPGNWNTYPDEDDEKLLIKLDWNINQDHRASLTYQHTESFQVRQAGSQASLLNLSSNGYGITDTLNMATASLYSDWTNEFSTDIRLGFKQHENRQVSLDDQSYGQVTVATDTGSVRLGPDIFRHANELDNDLLQFRANGEYLLGDHTIEFGWEHEQLDVFNMFVRRSLGEFDFASIDDFLDGNASSVRYENAVSNNPRDGAASFKYATNSLYIQDRWMVNYDLTLDFGLRYERISTSDKPNYNENFEQRYGFSNQQTFDGLDLWLPRVGFNYAFSDALNIRGGFGRFGGGRPNVWLSNSYTNDGINITSSSLNGQAFSGVDITQVPQAMQDSLVAGDGRVDVVDPNFKMPSEWKYSIGFDYLADLGWLGYDWVITGDYIYTDKESEAFYQDLGRGDMDPIVAPDGRLIYESGSRKDIMLTNADSGRSNILALGASKQWDNLALTLGYAYQDITDIGGFGSSQATSSYDRYATLNRDQANIGTSRFETTHRLNLLLTYTREFFSGYESRFTLYAERRSGERFSYTGYNDGSFGFGSDDRIGHLLYIPDGPNDNVRFEGWDYADFAALVQENGLSSYAGSVTPRNSGSTRYVNIVDFKFEQQVPGFSENHRGSVFFEIKNLLNLIDSSQGRQFGTGYPAYYNLANIDYDAAADEYIYSPATTRSNEPETFRAKASTWQAKVGVRYRF
ncbi:cell envelope biogenesis protein OmpA [Aliidiomarina minuta]|uniref:Cell envelope biogenesis protein OmpA n=1 Tax=Aliidiomarina minuta TaxID=880057 RepID=A0A432W395_9GAMM|nr:TonB-dependent receptor [Aliidiomarina minuta]RUO23844.1 cell envelope biogenesis protein OmpA [Aliidiomarina minuta]